mgnify:CR=1 FL=1
MYIVDRIEENYVILENRTNKRMEEVEIYKFPENIKEGDIIDFIYNKYIINEQKTIETKNNIRNRFNRLKNK